MSDYICVNIDKLKSLLPGFLLEISADGKCGGSAPVEPPDTVDPPPTEKPTKDLVGYLWENSNEVAPGRAFLMPEIGLTGKTESVRVGDEQLTFHSVYRNGREIWLASKGVANYGGDVITVRAKDAIYTSDVVEMPNNSGATEVLRYWGRHNGDRPTWYGNMDMTDYPDRIFVSIDGCISDVIVDTTRVDSDGNPRFVSGGLIVKQSDVAGRGLAVVYSSSCKSINASIKY